MIINYKRVIKIDQHLYEWVSWPATQSASQLVGQATTIMPGRWQQMMQTVYDDDVEPFHNRNSSNSHNQQILYTSWVTHCET